MAARTKGDTTYFMYMDTKSKPYSYDKHAPEPLRLLSFFLCLGLSSMIESFAKYSESLKIIVQQILLTPRFTNFASASLIMMNIIVHWILIDRYHHIYSTKDTAAKNKNSTLQKKYSVSIVEVTGLVKACVHGIYRAKTIDCPIQKTIIYL